MVSDMMVGEDQDIKVDKTTIKMNTIKELEREVTTKDMIKDTEIVGSSKVVTERHIITTTINNTILSKTISSRTRQIINVILEKSSQKSNKKLYSKEPSQALLTVRSKKETSIEQLQLQRKPMNNKVNSKPLGP